MARAIDVLGDRWTLLILATRPWGSRASLGLARRARDRRQHRSKLTRRVVDACVFIGVPYRDRRRTRHECRLTTAGADVLALERARRVWQREEVIGRV